MACVLKRLSGDALGLDSVNRNGEASRTFIISRIATGSRSAARSLYNLKFSSVGD